VIKLTPDSWVNVNVEVIVVVEVGLGVSVIGRGSVAVRVSVGAGVLVNSLVEVWVMVETSNVKVVVGIDVRERDNGTWVILNVGDTSQAVKMIIDIKMSNTIRD
jgi:hypothetical protein